MLRAGWAKVYVPSAAVIHSHDYSLAEWMRRSFDEARAMHEVYGWAGPRGTRAVALDIWGRVGADLRWSAAQRSRQTRGYGAVSLLTSATAHHLARALGIALAARAERLPPGLVERLSLERRRQ
jgi:rhamnosyltransferase